MRRPAPAWLLGLLALACAPPPAGGARPRIVATIGPVADWCRVLLADAAEVRVLLPSGRSPHAYEPTPTDARDVADARAVVGWGGAVDDWCADLLTQADFSSAVIWLYGPPAGHGFRHHEAATPGPGDPHTWLDPTDARARVQLLAERLAAALPQQAAGITERAREYDGALAALAARMARAGAAWDDHGVVAAHDGWRHFLGACGLRAVGTLRTASGAPASPRDLVRLSTTLRADSVRLILVEPQLNAAVAETLAREADAVLVALDPLGRAGVGGYDTYLAMMESNLEALAVHLGPIPPP